MEWTPMEIAYAVLNPSEGGDQIIREATAQMEKMDAADRLLFLSSVQIAGWDLQNQEDE